MTKVYIAETAQLADNKLFDALYRTVSKERQLKIDRYITKKNKRLSLAAGALLHKALKDHCIDNVEIVYGNYGKPYIKDNSVYFNLSHSEERVMCAVSSCEVGCDVEKIRDVDFGIADRFFNNSETAYLRRLTDKSEKTDAFFRLWTLKESFMKTTGMGMELMLDSFSVNISDKTVTVDQSFNAEEYYFKEYNFSDGYRYAICGISPDFEETAEFVSLLG